MNHASQASQPSVVHGRLLRRLETIAPLTEAERDGVARLPLELRHVAENTDIVREGDVPTHCVLITDGFASRYKTLADGQRQIMNFHIAGDVPDLQSLHLRKMDHSIGAMTPVTIAAIAHSAMFDLIERHPRVGSVFWRDTLIDASVFREWLLNVGRRNGPERVAHLICELHLRMASVGLADADSMPMPFTQSELGDATGLTAVHVNRVLQDLRRRELIGGHGRTVAILNGPALRRFCAFDPAYLYLRELPPWWT